MTLLTLQFLIVAVLPLSILATAVYVWRADWKRPLLRKRWIFTLLAAAVWASSLLRLFGGTRFSNILIFNWAVIGRYAMLVTALGILATTQRHFGIDRRREQLTLLLGVLLGLLAWMVDPATGLLPVPEWLLAGQPIRHFALWATVWIAAWLVPLVAASLLTRQVRRRLPRSYQRNQTDYWLLVLGIFGAGFALASIQQPGQPVWQEAGIMLSIVAIALGTLSLENRLLPDLRVALWQIGSRLAGIIIVFGVLWLSLTFVRRLDEVRDDVIIVLLAALLALLITAVYQVAQRVTRRKLAAGITLQETLHLGYSNAIGHAPEPQQLSQIFLRTLQFGLDTEDAWLLWTQDGSGGQLILRPLASIGSHAPETAEFRHNSPFTRHLRSHKAPLLQIDLETLEWFTDLDVVERAQLSRWQRVLFMPLHARDSLIGVLALGARFTGEAYTRRDFALLEVLATQISPLLVQAQNMATLRSLNRYLFNQNRSLIAEQQQLRELTQLQARFIALVAPDLQRPFPTIYQQLEQTQAASKEALTQEIDRLKTTLSQLINLAARVEEASCFQLQPVQLEEIARSAVRNLNNMAAARRVEVNLETGGGLPLIGDPQRLQEAVTYLLHNAIKFNRIGGKVTLETGISGDDTYLRLRDTGVGIPPEKLETLWNGFTEVGPTPYNQHSHQPKGVGLTFARYIIAAHGGRIEASSEYGSGSVFTIYLPATTTP